MFRFYDRAEQGNLVYFEPKDRRLFISEPLAMVMMRDAESWTNFLRGIHLWQYERQCARAWEKYMLNEELAAVREASKHSIAIPRAEIDRIRRARRNEIALSDMEPPAVAAYEYFIVRDTTEAESTILAVGHYDPDGDFVEMATWDEVRQFLSAK